MRLTKEATLVIESLRADGDPSVKRRLAEAIASDVDWSRVLSLVRSNGVLPIFRESVLQYYPQDIARLLQLQMQGEFQRCAAASLGYARELARVSNCLQRSGIRAIAFKGPALARQLRQKYSLRQSRDLDILVDKDQFQDAIAVLERAGYAPIWSETSGPQRLPEKHILLVRDIEKFKVELHWSIAPRQAHFQMRFDDLWNRREQVDIFGCSVAVPGREDLLLILCFHAAGHLWGSLKWTYDIARLLNVSPSLHWGWVISRARNLGCLRILLVGLALAADTMEVELPEELKEKIKRDRAVQKIRTDALDRFSNGTTPPNCAERNLTQIRSRERLWDRLKLILDFIGQRLRPNVRDREWVRLPNCLAFFYIFVRVLRIGFLQYKTSVLPLLRTIRSA